MKITIREDSDSRLKIRLRPSYLPVYLLAGALGIVGGWFVLKLLAVSITITVEDGELTYTKAFLGKYELARHSARVDQIRDIVVEVPEGSGSYEIVVTTLDSSFTMPLVAEGGEGKERIAVEVRNALVNQGGKFHHVDGSMIAGLVLGLVVAAGGLVCLAVLQTSTVNVDRLSGEAKVRRRLWLLPFVGSTRTVSIEDLRNVELSSFSVWGRGGEVISYNVVIQTEAYGGVPVAYGPMFREESGNELIRLLRKAKAKKRKR